MKAIIYNSKIIIELIEIKTGMKRCFHFHCIFAQKLLIMRIRMIQKIELN